VDYSFSSTATDPDTESIAIRFAWGDGDTSSWSSYYPSGSTVSMSYSWPSPDTYYVTAQCKDIRGLTSQWSNPHQVVICYTFPDKVIATIPVGTYPRGICVFPSGEYLYVANENDGRVSVIRIPNNTVITNISVGLGPWGVCALPNGQYVYVVNSLSSSVSVIDPSYYSVIGNIYKCRV